jgi:hypothetical protein
VHVLAAGAPQQFGRAVRVAASASVVAWNRVMTAVISCIDMGPLLVR